MTFEEYWKDKGEGTTTVSLKTIWKEAQAEAAKEILAMLGESKLMMSHDITVFGKIAERFISND